MADSKKTFLSMDFLKMENSINIIVAVVILIVSVILANVVSKKIKNNDKLKSKKIVLETMGNLTYYIIIVLGTLIAFINAGFQIGSIIVVLSSLGIAVALGVKNILSQFASGLIITFSDLYNINDRIITEGIEGKVSQFDLLNTTIKNNDNITIIIPNDKIIRNKITNITRESIIRASVEFQIKTSPGFSGDKFREIIKKTAALSKYVVNDDISVNITNITHFRGITFVVKAYIKSEDYSKAKNDIRVLILRVLGNTEFLKK